MKIEDSGAADVQGETPYLANDFTSTGLVPIILGTPQNELGDKVTIYFIRHVPQKITCGDGGLIGTPFVDHTVCVVIKDLLLESV